MMMKPVSYKRKLFLLFVFAMLVPLSILCILFYRISASSVRDNAIRVYSDVLKQVVTVVDSELEQIENLSTVYAGSKWVQTIAYMQGDQIDYSRIDAYMLRQYGDFIERIETTNPFSCLNALIFVDKKTCMLNSGLWSTNALFRSGMNLNGMEPEEALEFVAGNGEETYVFPNSEQSSYLYIIKKVPLMARWSNVQLLNQIQVSSIVKVLDSGIGVNIRLCPTDTLTIESSGAREMRDDGPENYLQLTYTSPINGWTYYGYVPESILAKDLYKPKRLLIYTEAVILLISMFMAIWFMYTAYRPIKILSEETGGETLGGQDALENIKHSILYMTQNNQKLNDRIDAFGPLAKEAMFANLICGVISREQAWKMAELLGISTNYKHWAVAVFLFDADLTESVEKLLLEKYNYLLHIEVGRTIAISGFDDDSTIIEDWKKLALSTGITCGISEASGDIDVVSTVYVEAMIALELSSMGQPTLYQDVVSCKSIFYKYPPESENALYNLVRQGDYERAYLIFNETLEQNNDINIISRRCLIYDMMSTVFRICHHDHLEPENLNIWKFSVRDYQELEFAAFETLREVCRKEKTATAEKDDSRLMAAKMLQYVKEHYKDPNMSLGMLADHFGITLQYASKFYKEYCGENFLDTIMRLRIDESKRILGSEEDSVASVGMRVGFGSTTSFQRAFKKLEGITPKEYKNGRNRS